MILDPNALEMRGLHITAEESEKRIRNLGLPDFESLADCDRRQSEMLRRLVKFDSDIDHYRAPAVHYSALQQNHRHA